MQKNKKTRGTNSNNSKPLGATKVWYNLNKIQQFEHIFILNGDKVTLEEFTLLKELNIPYTYFLLKRKFNDDGKTLLKKNASLSEKIGLSYVISTLNDETQTSETQSDEKQVTENNQDKTTNLLPEICDKVVEKKKEIIYFNPNVLFFLLGPTISAAFLSKLYFNIKCLYFATVFLLFFLNNLLLLHNFKKLKQFTQLTNNKIKYIFII